MDWNVIMSTFITVFLAEIGDKTQLSTMMLASRRSPTSVFAGSALALIASSLIGVIIGDNLMRLIPPGVIRVLAGGGFLVVGILILAGRM